MLGMWEWGKGTSQKKIHRFRNGGRKIRAHYFFPPFWIVNILGRVGRGSLAIGEEELRGMEPSISSFERL